MSCHTGDNVDELVWLQVGHQQRVGRGSIAGKIIAAQGSLP